MTASSVGPNAAPEIIEAKRLALFKVRTAVSLLQTALRRESVKGVLPSV